MHTVTRVAGANLCIVEKTEKRRARASNWKRRHILQTVPQPVIQSRYMLTGCVGHLAVYV